MKQYSDIGLLTLMREGDHRAFRVFFDKYWEKLFASVYSSLQDEDEAKDIVQDIFIQVWNSRDTIYLENSFEPFLFKSARNQVISLYRKKQVKLNKEDELIERLSRLDETDDHLLEKELNSLIDSELEKMPLFVKQCFQLSRKEGKSISEIAAQLSLSEQTVKNYISESLRRLRIQLKNHSIEYLALVLIISEQR
ncbi:RNA polymerase sigma factor [Desertivirga xinjiangensis]|uniref:RNA polymerase sigma factor n=1 Tax=Desertivirga xinjiangensis TaxID=539206 RepID=UPI00210E4D16|nr:RNA polymerase sigma-70 factor [Pedobacter xinjiangensis]